MKCELEKHGRCCCICRWHLEAHPHADFPHSVQGGWVCVGFAFCEGVPIAYTGFSKHGLCELFVSRETAGPVDQGDDDDHVG